MEHNFPNVETRFEDMSGAISVNFREDFMSFAIALANIDVKRYSPVGFRVYYQHNIILTIYTIDNHERTRPHLSGKQPVTKFKVEVSLSQILSKFKQVDFILVSEGINVDDFVVNS